MISPVLLFKDIFFLLVMPSECVDGQGSHHHIIRTTWDTILPVKQVNITTE